MYCIPYDILKLTHDIDLEESFDSSELMYLAIPKGDCITNGFKMELKHLYHLPVPGGDISKCGKHVWKGPIKDTIHNYDKNNQESMLIDIEIKFKIVSK